MRVGGFVLGGACFAAFAGVTIAASAGQPGPTSISHSAAHPVGPRAASNARLDLFNQPVLMSLTPSSGPTAGGTNVVIASDASGGFLTATDVNFGGVDINVTPCGTSPCFNIDSDTQITVMGIPGGSAGPVSVNVVTPSGTSGNLTYTYVAPAPTLTSLTPSTGFTTGGNSVVLGGANFTGATDVNFGATDITQPCTSPCFTVDTDSQITVTGVLAHAAGGVPVDVVTGSGTSNSVTYFYVTPAPTLTSLTPSTGFTTGGNSVVLGGTNFTGATDVNFGATDITQPCTSPCFTVDTDSQITVTGVLAHAAGGVPVDVVTGGGTTSSITYFYVTPAPTLTSVTPSTGSTAGGNSVVLGGTNFTGATDVNVGSIDLKPCPSAPCFTVDSDIQITVTMPPSTPGPFNVDVVTLGGTTAGLSYTFVAPIPTVTGVSPNAGASAGGNTVTLTGTDFEAAGSSIVSQVTVGSTAVASCITSPTGPCFTVTSVTSITVQLLPAGTGQIHITVTTSGGTSPVASGNVYTYVAVFPNVLTVSPKYGAAGGGSYVAIFGSNFGNPSLGFGATDILFGTKDVSGASAYPCPGSANGCFSQIGTDHTRCLHAASRSGHGGYQGGDAWRYVQRGSSRGPVHVRRCRCVHRGQPHPNL